MRVALRGNLKRQAVSRGVPDPGLPAPVEGWDAISPLAKMKPTRAIVLDNWFPQAGYIELRKGTVRHADTGIAGGKVDSVMGYHGLTANKLFSAVSTKVYDVTTAGTATEALTGLANARWNHLNYATSGGNFLWMANGADTPRFFDGTSWTTATITGLTSSRIINPAVFKSRIWFAITDSLDPWYLATDSVQGAATVFPLRSVFRKGGTLMAIGTWSLEGGEGPDDLIAFVTSRGEVAVYSGTDPASNFAIRGRYELGSPLGRRCLVKVGGDLAYASIDGVLPLSLALPTDRGAAETVAITRRIQPVMAQSARDWGANYGWQMTPYARGTMGILNVPASEGSQQYQYVMNTVTGAWCRFLGWNFNTFEVWQDRLFAGGNNGVIYEADRSGSDAGASITADVRTAWQYFGRRDRLKRWKLCRPLMVTDGAVSPGLAVNVDFGDDAAIQTISTAIEPSALWDVALWDVGIWPEERRVVGDWQTVSGVGYCASVRMRAQVQALGSQASLWDQGVWDVSYWDGQERSPIVLQVNGWDLTMQDGVAM